MAFKIEGTIEVTIMEAFVQECRFQPEANEVNNRNEYVQCYYDVALLVQDANGNNDTWYGEISTRTGVGNHASDYRYDMTLKTLQEIGFNVQTLQELEAQFQPTNDRSISIPNLIGTRCKVVTENKVFTKRDGTQGQTIRIKYLNNINSEANGAKRLNFDQFMAARRGTAPVAAPVTAPAPAPAAPASYQQASYQQAAPQYQQPATAPAAAPMPPPAAATNPAPAPTPAQVQTQNCPY